MEEGGTIVSKIGGQCCVAIGGLNFGGRGGTKSKVGFQGMGGRNDLVHRSIISMVTLGNTSWEGMNRSVIVEVTRAGFCRLRRESTITILQILTPRQYSCSVSDLLIMNKDSSIKTNMSGSWQEACR